MLQTLASQYRRYRRSMIVMFAVMLVFAMTAVSQAQTPVPIEIPTDDMITNLNQWIEILAPIVLFVGMIPVALGLLQYIVGLFQRAFRGG